jgi:para-nitrobenzyl esterase
VSAAGFGPWTHEYVVDGPVSEDCLYLNVWSKAGAGGGRPVLVWIHGGGFSQGSGSVPIYDGAGLAAKGVVVVTINYRLGVLGFFAHPALTAEARGSPPGNYGLQDMVAALKWVRANIAAFGGDPDAVTIAGQSAGAMAIHDLIASPLAKGLFRGAIIESGLPGVAPTLPLAQAEAAGEALAKAKGAASIRELRAMSPEQLTAGSRQFFAPIQDGVLLPAGSTTASDTPVLIGMNADEGSALAAGDYGQSDPAKLQALLKASYGDMADRFGAFYPASNDAERAEASRQILRDRGLGALYAWSLRRERQSDRPLYLYLWTHIEPGHEADRFRAFHSSEIPYALRTLDTAPERGFTAKDRALSDLVSGYWLNFIRTGDPNGAGLTAWPAWTASHPVIMELGDPTRTRPILPAAQQQAVDDFLRQGGQPRLF